MRWVVLWTAVCAGAALGCELAPPAASAAAGQAKSPGDNFFKLLVSGDTERYVPGQRYVVSLVGSRTHERVQQFTRFRLVAAPLDARAPRSPRRQGQFQLFADTLSQFHDGCLNTVVEADDLPKTEVQVVWRAPEAGSGCVNLKAMVVEESGAWFAEDGQLTRRMCEEVARDDGCCACDDAKYKVVFEGLWSPETHPKDFPTARWLTHFSDLIGATHGKNFSFWGEGKIASDGFRSLAEWGSVQLMERELRQSGKKLRSIVKAAGLWHPHVNSNTSSTFTVDRKRHLVSVASMFGPSPDWVVGVSGLDLCQKDCTWKQSQIVDLFPYDAGTDNGITYMSPNAESSPRERMYRITPMYPEDPRAPFYAPGAAEVPPLARLHLAREQLVPRACDEEVLQQLVAEVAENTETVDRPECAVGEWTAWSACSVSCGKGLRMRSREYRMPQKAAMFRCDRQLVSKEMCVADVAECEESPAEEAEPEAGAVEDLSGICATSEWGPWSECSVTCGVGVNTRRRDFLDRMGRKKCPLVDTVEERKCMEPACTEAEGAAVSDPGCPTTEWSSWSTCSASCGRGVRLRTRLLLVPPDRQLDCSAKVEMLQQRPCSERDDCTVDMATAKQICMEETDPGPCRGVYQRWTFMAQKGMCVPFVYFGCRGNRNNFLTQEDCTSTCQIVIDSLTGAGGGVGGAGAAGPGPGAFQDTNTLSQPATFGRENQPTSSRAEAAAAGACRLSGWSEWSACSVSCGTGYQERTRTVLTQAQPGGAPCPPRMSRRRRCHRSC